MEIQVKGIRKEKLDDPTKKVGVRKHENESLIDWYEI